MSEDAGPMLKSMSVVAVQTLASKLYDVTGPGMVYLRPVHDWFVM